MELSPVSRFSEMPTTLKGVLSKVTDSLTETVESVGRKIIEGMRHIRALAGGGVAQSLADVDATVVSSMSTVISKTDHVGTRQLKVTQARTVAPQIAFAKDGSINVIREAPATRRAFFQGGGVKGMTYAPFLRVLNDQIGLLKSLREVAGTSAGACIAFLVASGLSPDEIESYLKNIDLLKELGGSSIEGLKLRSGGVFSGNKMVSTFTTLATGPAAKYCEDLIKNNPAKFDQIRNDERFDGFMERAQKHFLEGMTFNDLKLLNQLEPEQFKLLHVTAFDSDKKEPVYFNADDTPDVFCHHAVRASMAIPHFFKPVQIGERTNLQDGGVATNAPLEIFTRQADYKAEETVGFVFDKSGSAHKILHGPKTEIRSFRDLFMEGANKVRALLGMGSLEVGNQSSEFIREKVSPFRAFVLGKGYVEARANDAEKIHGLGFNAFVVPHGKLGTFSFGTSAKKVSEATGQAIAAAKDYAEWRKDMATYTTYDNVDAAIASMRDEERDALIKSAKEDIGSYLRKNPKEIGDQIKMLKAILEMDNPDLDIIFDALKFIQGANRLRTTQSA